jgi:hypothetical protein
MSISSSVLLSSISGLVISFPKNTIRWMLAGQSVPGVLCIACQIFFLSRQFDPRVTGIKHCTLTSTIITVTLVAFLIARRTVIKLQKSDFVLTSCFLSLSCLEIFQILQQHLYCEYKLRQIMVWICVTF